MGRPFVVEFLGQFSLYRNQESQICGYRGVDLALNFKKIQQKLIIEVMAFGIKLNA